MIQWILKLKKMVNQRMKGRKSLTYVKIPKPFQIESEESEESE